jgi:hypothetical protein
LSLLAVAVAVAIEGPAAALADTHLLQTKSSLLGPIF